MTNESNRKYMISPLRKMVRELTGLGDIDIMKAESIEALVKQTGIYRLDMICKWGKTELTDASWEAERLLEIMKDFVGQLNERKGMSSPGI